jgi:hypothetical protein
MRALLVAALTGLAAALLAPTGANAASCWQRVLDDWRDGHLDAVYPVHCYRDALKNLPEDLRVYGTAQNDIQNALARVLARAATPSRPAARVVAHRAPARVTPAKTRSKRTPTAAPDRTRTLAAHSTKQPTLRLTAAATPDDTGSGFPLAPVLAGALALAVALVVVASLHAPRRRRH